MPNSRPKPIAAVHRAARRSRLPKTAGNAVRLAELGLAVPQVVAHRLSRMALAGPAWASWSERDRREFSGMVSEKQTAFLSAWMAMWGQLWRAQQAMWLRCFNPLAWMAPPSARSLGQQASALALRMAGAGLVPVHKKAVSNAKRLGKTPLR